MRHLLMSNEELDTATPSPGSNSNGSNSKVLEFRRPGDHGRDAVRARQLRQVEQDLEPLRRQVTSIIDEILSDTGPEEAEVREKLRWHVANNPGKPEKALLKHLLTVAVRQDESA
ncbi:hypothetical protein [Pseudarthrobacter sp. S9]|uniref:hypothetical protein n=1 Tax=Pseudarthrobacter sp. S9 TaxID=3418421 RepID=UPI003CFF4B2B